MSASGACCRIACDLKMLIKYVNKKQTYSFYVFSRVHDNDSNQGIPELFPKQECRIVFE